MHRKIWESELESEILTGSSNWDFEKFTVGFIIEFTTEFTIYIFPKSNWKNKQNKEKKQNKQTKT